MPERSLQSFKPSPALKKTARSLIERNALQHMQRIDAFMHRGPLQSHSNKEAAFLQMLFTGPQQQGGDINSILLLLRDIAEGNMQQHDWVLEGKGYDILLKRAEGGETNAARLLEDARAWCREMRAKYQGMSDIIDEAATGMAARIGDKKKIDRSKIASDIVFLDQALGTITEMNAFVEQLLAELERGVPEKESYTTIQRQRRDKSGGGTPMAF